MLQLIILGILTLQQFPTLEILALPECVVLTSEILALVKSVEFLTLEILIPMFGLLAFLLLTASVISLLLSFTTILP